MLGAAAGAVASYLSYVVTALLVLGVHRPWPVLAGAILSRTIALLVISQGAKVGAILAPVVGWALLRRVPLGWASLGLAAGAFSGGLSGDWLVGTLFYGVNTAGWFPQMWGAAIGVVLTAGALRVVFRSRRAAHVADESAGDAAMPLASAPELLIATRPPVAHVQRPVPATHRLTRHES